MIAAFLQYARRFFQPIQDLSEKYNLLQSAMASSERIFKLLDTLYWGAVDLPSKGLHFLDQYPSPYGFWLMVAELGVFGILPALMLLNRRIRMSPGWLAFACLLTCTGVVFNRFVMTVVSLALPVLPFDRLATYWPSWQEWAPALAILAYGALIISLSYRYLPVFPQEKELN